jgi:GAF domain-containing protein
LYLSEKRSGGECTEDDKAVLTALGSAAGISIENARLYDEAQRVPAVTEEEEPLRRVRPAPRGRYRLR